MDEQKRDFIGYGANSPDPKWPGGAAIALNFVLNVEAGSAPSVQDGEGFSETMDVTSRPKPSSNMAAASASGGCCGSWRSADWR